MENSKNKVLTEEQHELLEELCRVRHEVHSHWENFFNHDRENSPSSEKREMNHVVACGKIKSVVTDK